MSDTLPPAENSAATSNNKEDGNRQIDAQQSPGDCQCVCRCKCNGDCKCPPTSDQSYEFEIYKIFAELFNSEETAFWARNNVLVVVQAGLIAAMAAFASNADKLVTADGHASSAFIFFIGALAAIDVVGFGMAIAWLLMVHRSARIADTISDELKAFEKEFENHSAIKLGKKFWVFNHFGGNLAEMPADAKNKIYSKGSHAKPTKLNRYRISNIWSFVGGFLLLIWLILGVGLGAYYLSVAKKDAQPIGVGQPPVCPSIECQKLGFIKLGVVGPFCTGQSESQACDAQKLSQPDMAQLQQLVASIHRVDPVQLTLVGSADRVGLKPELLKKYGSNEGLARARAEWVLAQIKEIWQQTYPAQRNSAALNQAQILSVGPAGFSETTQMDDRVVYVYVLVPVKADS